MQEQWQRQRRGPRWGGGTRRVHSSTEEQEQEQMEGQRRRPSLQLLQKMSTRASRKRGGAFLLGS